MSVNAIGPQPVQSDNKRGLLYGTGSAVVGAGVGSFVANQCGGKTPGLQGVFEQDKDTFKASEEAMKKKNEEAAKKVVEGRDAYTEAVKGAKEEEAAAVKVLEDKAASIADYENKTDLDKAVEEANKALDSKEVNVTRDEKEVKVKYSELNETEKASKEVAEAVKPETEAVENAKKAVLDAQVKKLREEAAKEDASEELKGIVKAADDAAENTKKAQEDALKNVSDEVKSAFNKVKRALTEGKGKAMLIWGAIGATVLGIVGYLIGKSVDKK